MDQLLAAFNETRERRQVLQDFAADPTVCVLACQYDRVFFIEPVSLQTFSLMWMASQSADEAIIARGPSVQHAARRAEFYDDDWVAVSSKGRHCSFTLTKAMALDICSAILARRCRSKQAAAESAVCKYRAVSPVMSAARGDGA